VQLLLRVGRCVARCTHSGWATARLPRLSSTALLYFLPLSPNIVEKA